MKRPSWYRDSLIVDSSAGGLKTAVACLREGGLVAFPTETSYGLAVDAYQPAALERLYTTKNRPRHKPILVLIDRRELLESIVSSIPERFHPLMDRFWPGPLTLIFPASPKVPELLTGGSGTIGVRISSAIVAQELCQMVNGPITATSANVSANAPARSAQGVLEQFGSKIDIIVDGGVLPESAGSTIVAEHNGIIEIIRPGEITANELNDLK